MTDQTKKRLVVAGGVILCAVLAFLIALRATPKPPEPAASGTDSGTTEARLAVESTETETQTDAHPDAAPTASPSGTTAPFHSDEDAASERENDSAPLVVTVPETTAPQIVISQEPPSSGASSSGAPESGTSSSGTSSSGAPVVILPPAPQTSAPSAANAPDMEGAEQSLQPEVTRPASASTGETQVRPDDPALLDPSAPPTTTPSASNQPLGGETKDGKVYVPGFGWIKDIGEGHGTHLSDMYENGNKIGVMN